MSDEGRSMKATRRLVAVIIVCAITHPAKAGSDLFITEIFDTSATQIGTIGNITSYSFSTAFCNVGDEGALWWSTNNQHPVVAQHAYRFEVVNGAGRFEQIGLSWIKHGTCADPRAGFCGDCNPNVLCEDLPAGCADVYTAGLNANQQFLGPRSDVDPFTGAFDYPFTTQGQTGDVLFKRLQIANSDLDPVLHPGAAFFVEQQVVTVDEDVADRFNNVSWKDLTVGAFADGGFDLATTNAIHDQAPAIEAWPLHDVGVTLVDKAVLDDGRFVLGYKVTELSPGNSWHYEYGLYNRNVHRAARSFEVPLAPKSTEITNIGFHDVDYHSGEAVLGEDWAFTVSPSGLQWRTDPFSVCPNANAIRWGTTYNFRFDADRPPFPGTISIRLFRPGTPSVYFPIFLPPRSDGGTRRRLGSRRFVREEEP